MKLKTFHILIAIFILVALSGILIRTFGDSKIGNIIALTGINLTHLTALLHMALLGTFKRSKYFKITLVFLILLSVSILFKTLHWFGGDYGILFSSSIVAIIYALWFFGKQEKKRMDIMKFIWICAAFLLYPWLVFHWIGFEFVYILVGLFWLMFIDFYITELKKLTA